MKFPLIRNLCFAACGLIAGLAVSPFARLSATAQSAELKKKCDYTYIQDAGEPNIGKTGQIKYDDSWTNVVEAGWTLKAIAGYQLTTLYVFEKCRS